MGIFTKLGDRIGGMFRGFRAGRPNDLADFWYGPVGQKSSAGITITPEMALAVAAVFSCVTVRSEVFGSLPWRIYRRDQADPRRKEPAHDHELWSVLHDRPNPWQTDFEWKAMGEAHLCLRGNFYCRQWLGSDGRLWLVPLNPDRMAVEQLPNYRLRYTYRAQSGEPQTFDQAEIFHVRGMSLNGITGVGPLEYARNSIGLATAQEQHGASLFRNGGLPSFWISRPAGPKWTDTARTNWRKSWRKVTAGPENAGNPPVLEDGMELHDLGVTNEDLQWIDGQNFSGVQICRFFRVPPHLAYFLDRATFNNIEQLGLEFVVYTMAPECVRWEKAANTQILDPDDRAYYTKLALDALLRGDFASRTAGQNLGVLNGTLTVNEAREMEDRNPVEGGDEARFPLNMSDPGGGPDRPTKGEGGRRGTREAGRGEGGDAGDDQAAARREQRRQQRREKRRAKEAAILEPLIHDVAARIAAAEDAAIATRAEKAAADPDRFAAWLRDEFAPRHGVYVARTVAPLLAATGQAATLAGLTADLLAGQPTAANFANWRTARPAALHTILRQHLGLSV